MNKKILLKEEKKKKKNNKFKNKYFHIKIKKTHINFSLIRKRKKKRNNRENI